MARMTEDDLLTDLQAMEEDSATYSWGQLGSARETAMREYHRMPYGNEEEGWSTVVTSEVQDTVEWTLPDLIDIYVSTDKAVIFEPERAEDVEGAKQATETVNHVFYKQNNGFLVLHTAFKDALIAKNCAVMWRKETRRTKSVIPVRGATADVLAAVLADHKDAEIEEASEVQAPMLGPDGQPVIGPDGVPVVQTLINARVSYIEQKKRIVVEAFPPDELLVKRDWTSPLLDECPYVSRSMRVTLSDLKQMGFDVTAEELAASTDTQPADATLRMNRAGMSDAPYMDRTPPEVEDESQTEGYLRIEFVLADFDGDGIAERRCIYRLRDKILSNEECAQVQIATASPILVSHHWCGMSVAEIVSDLQQLKTELTRQVMNSAYLANNPRKKVLIDSTGAPLAELEDLLDSRIGGVIRMRQADAVQDDVMPFVGGHMYDLLGYIDVMGERRTGVSRVQQGIDPNVLKTNRTLGEARMTNQIAKQRIKLIARIFGEVLLKPIFLGIFKLLTEGDMERLAFQLNGRFVDYDPNEWRDGYNMTVTVGLGTGDRDQQLAMLQAIFQSQLAMMQTPFAPLLVTPQNVHTTQVKMVEAAGYKNPDEFWTNPQGQLPQPPQPVPDPQVQIKQMELTAEAQRFQAETQRLREADERAAAVKLREQEGQFELQRSNDERDAARAQLEAIQRGQQAEMAEANKRFIAELNAQEARYKTDADNATKLQLAAMSQEGSAPDIAPLAEQIAQLQAYRDSPAEIVRDAAGRAVGVKRGDVVREIVRGPDGRAIGVK